MMSGPAWCMYHIGLISVFKQWGQQISFKKQYIPHTARVQFGNCLHARFLNMREI